ncbi:breast cancer type 1 susceptibility protein homolog [Myripristis murdjan]|uniref:RING-type E3 ubiquitin transferase BRCA1 n=1 Tax=Myripristis murdjan TaxID=586833 RepID=A0A667ZMT7_9TELE|nr:breast cancer type 1 susceptibility protein [Myripristis murdjan]
MKTPKAADVKRGIAVLWETLQCPICLDLMITPVSTKCDHQFCKLCMTKLLDSAKQKEANCPVCKTKITKRSLQESPGFQRLVAGLQDMIQAYEFDTCTNYFTGLSQQRRPPIGTEAKVASSGDTSGNGLGNSEGADHDDLSRSPSSTIAALHGFAKLMGLKESFPSNEGLDSGLGDAPPASENKMHSPVVCNMVESIDTEMSEVVGGKKKITQFDNPSPDPVLIPDEEQHQPLRQSKRKNKKKDSERDKILQQRQKKSVEKVSEWLMKVPPTEENFELEKNTEDTSDTEYPDCLSCSSSSSSTIKINRDKSDVNLTRQRTSAKALEDQVFGTVYKREQRRNRAISAQPVVFVDPPQLSPFEATQTPEISRRKSSKNNLTPADFVKKPYSEDKNERGLDEQPQNEEQANNTDISKDTEQMPMDLNDCINSTENLGEELNKLRETDNNNKDEADSAVSDIELHQPERNSNKGIQNILQHLDSDLQKQAETKLEGAEKKKMGKKKGKKAKLDKSKSARVPKPLVLVGVQDEGHSPVEILKPRPGSEDVQIHIENYPSSEDPETTVMRSTRRSRRLKFFTEEVQASHKKACAPKNTKAQVSGNGSNMVKPSEEASASTSDDMTSHENGQKATLAKRNGCICDEDIGGIEKMESSTSASMHLRTEALASAEESVVEVPNTASPSEASAACFVPMVPSTRSPPEATVVDPAFESVGAIKPSSNNTLLIKDQLESSACEEKFVEMEQEEDKNDSELDTEQLLKSFKATKRKSFHLGGPNAKRSHLGLDKENLQSATPGENCHAGPGTKSVTNQTFINEKESSITHQEDKGEIENSSCNDVISPSNSPIHNAHKPRLNPEIGQKKTVAKSDQVAVEGSIHDTAVSTQESAVVSLSRSTVSSGLSPNEVAKSQTEGLHISKNNSGLHFRLFGLSGEDLLNGTPLSSKHSQITENQPVCTTKEIGEMNQIDIRDSISLDNGAVTEKPCTENTVKHVVNTESSLTPDGLISEVHKTMASTQGSGELSACSPIKTRTRKRKRCQKLESSSESDDSIAEEDLPTLAQIFRTTAPSAVEKESSCLPDGHAQDQGDLNKADNSDGACVKADEQMSHPPACPSPDCVDSSQGSVDLFGTPDECEVPANGTEVSMESSQFSNEVLVTQQKIAMKEELVRLEKLMALVSEVLQEKESDPAVKVPAEIPVKQQSNKSTGHSNHTPLPCEQSANPSSDREAPPGTGREPSTVTPGPGAADGSTAGTAVQHLVHTEPRIRGSRVTKISSSDSGVTPANKVLKNSGPESAAQEDKETNVKATSTSLAQAAQRGKSGAKLVLVSSGLASSEQVMVKKFAKRVGGHVVSQVTTEVTHVIMHTDEQLVCERTLKYFLGIAGRKWVMSFQWISECFKQGRLLDESPFEVRGDVVNGPSHQGPMRARTTGADSLLMKGYKICFQGPFTDMTTDQMEWMVELCGAAVVKDPLLLNSKQKSHQLVIVQPGSESSPSKFSALLKRATVLTRGWLLDTVATYTLQSFNNYTP